MRIATLILAASLCGCATAYQAKGGTGGFSETWQSDRSVEVTFNGNGYTSTEVAEQYALVRASELALEKGYPYLRRAEAATEVTTTKSGSFLTGGRRTTNRPETRIVAVFLTEEQAAELQTQGVPVVSARLFIEQNAPDDVRERILGQ